MSKQYYLQDSRQYVGNDILFWAQNGAGYTTDVGKAHVFTEAEAMLQHSRRETDIPLLKEYIDQHTRRVVDQQDIDFNEARVILL